MTIKAVFFDWGGTIAKMPMHNSWNEIDKALGCVDEMNALEGRYLRKELGYPEWCRLSVDVYVRLGLTEKTLQGIADRVTLHKGVNETLSELRSRGIKIGIVSGGIYNLYEYAARKFGISADHVAFATTLNFDKSGLLAGGKYSASIKESKLQMLKDYLRDSKLSPEELLYVGHTHDDIPVFKMVTGIAFSADSEESKRNAKYVIKGDDLREVLKYVA